MPPEVGPPAPEAPPPAAKPVLSRRALSIGAVSLVAIAALIVIIGVTTRRMADARLREWTEKEAVPVVAVAFPDSRSKSTRLELPGRLEAYTQAQMYARVSGYVKEWKVDIGTPVKAGDLLAVIDAPDLDQQIMQAQADLAAAKANSVLADLTLTRGQSLIKTYAISQQDLDQRAADASNKQGIVRAQQANLDRLRVLEQYKRIVAPFDGLVTARATDIGALINAGQSAGTELFRLADTHKLRIYVQVPEPYAAAAKPGLEAELKFSEQSGKSYTARVVRTSNALDPGLRTLQVELQIDNPQRELFPGAYAEVHFKLASSARSLRLPANTVLFRAPGLQVATVDAERRIQLRSIVEGRDFGNTIEVLSGLDDDADVVINPPDSIISGLPVRVAARPGEAAGKAAAQAP